MTSPYDRARDRMDSGEQPFKDAREAMTRNETRLQDQAEAFGEAHSAETDEERRERRDVDAAERLEAVQDELQIERDLAKDGR